MRRSVKIAALLALVPLVMFQFAQAQDAPAEEKITYADQIQPIFRQRCGTCHNANDRKGSLAVDSFSGLMAGGSSGESITPGDPSLSLLWELINHDAEPFMPLKEDKLPEAQLATIRKWIEMGALENSGSVAKVVKSSDIGRIEVTGDRPAEVAMPVGYLGDPEQVAERPNTVTALAVSPWASLAAVSSHEQISLVETKTFAPLGVLPFPEGQPHILKFSRNGSLLLAGGGRGGASGKVVVYDVKTGKRMIEVGDEFDLVLAADISPDLSRIALGGPKRMLRVYSSETGELLYEIKKHTDWITAIEFSPDGVLVASADRSSGLIVWESATGQLFHDLTGHREAVTDVSFRPDSNALVSASEDGTIKLWGMEEGNQIKSWDAHGAAMSVEFVRDGRIVSTGRDRRVRLWKGDGEQIREFEGLDDIGLEVAFDAESERVLGGDWTGVVHVWEAAEGQAVGKFTTNPTTLDQQIETLQERLAEISAERQTEEGEEAPQEVQAIEAVLAQLRANQPAASENANE